jgi:hypothetical protein
MTFITDDAGHAEANIHVACRDNDGAVSDTVTQYIPLRNFPPVINFQADYDTISWSYGAAIFRFFAIDLDGNETMSDSFRYRLDTADTTIVRDFGAPDADPSLCWVRKAFDDDERRTFTVELRDVSAAVERTLTVAVSDEALAETRFPWSWQVREALSPVLLVMDAAPFIDELYIALMDSVFGVDQWSRYEMLYFGLPDEEWVLLETFRQFSAVLWYTGSLASQTFETSTNLVSEYLYPPEPEVDPGRLLFISKDAAGAYSNLPYAFIQSILGVSPTADPPNVFYIPTDKQALGQQAWLPDITTPNGYAATVGVTPLNGTEILYQLEYCRCYDVRPSFEPIVGVRRPERTTDPLARVVVMTTQLEYFVREEAIAALRAILSEEMGVTTP